MLEALAEPDADGRTLRLALALQEDFALNQPLASFALVALDLLDPESREYAYDVVSVVEAILDDPFPVLMAQANKERGDAVAEMKVDGHRVRGADGAARGDHLPQAARRAARAGAPRCTGRRTRGCASPTSPRSRSCATCTSGASRSPSSSPTTGSRAPRASCCATSATPTARCARRCPTASRPTSSTRSIEWLGETVRQVDSSLLDEWEALTDPESVARARPRSPPARRRAPPRPITATCARFPSWSATRCSSTCTSPPGTASTRWRSSTPPPRVTDPPGGR